MAGGIVALRPGTHANRLVRHGLEDVARHLRYSAGWLQGVAYRMAGRHPDDSVDDGILADRIRSELGGVQKKRDLPHTHVMVENHVALLHGDVPTQEDADAIVRAVEAVAGVQGVTSHLHVGLFKGDTRPSEGHAPH
jgi:osmotically-inducible protein OsmY